MDQQQEERQKQLSENETLRVKLNEVLQQFDTFNQLVSGPWAGPRCPASGHLLPARRPAFLPLCLSASPTPA